LIFSLDTTNCACYILYTERSNQRYKGGIDMETRRFIAYYRVSTTQQGESGLGLEAQKESVHRYLAANGGTLVNGEFVEVETGTNKRKRPALAEALRQCRIFKATLIVAKLDRLSRNVGFISRMLESNVEFVAVDNPAANRTMIQMTSVMAEWEARAISERTKAALAALKARGKKLGGDRGKLHLCRERGQIAGRAVRTAKAQAHAADIMPIITEIKSVGVGSLRQIATALNERGIPAARGGEWSAIQVRRVIGTAAYSHPHGSSQR
jgi:DNA invertase Pin-like site-specific DNA recombinase